MLRLLDESNRGLLLDLVVLCLNLLGILVLESFFHDVLRRAAANDGAAMSVLFAGGVLLLVLPPVGATLKRWHYHRRRDGNPVDISDGAAGCLFNPIFYFCLTAVIFAAVNAFILQGRSGGREPTAALFVTSMFIGIGLMITHTVLVYRFFSPPKAPPRSAFMRSRASEFIGDACLFLNMLLFQFIWNLLSFAGVGSPGGVVDFLGRLLLLCFLALLLYFPPRMFYLADDAGKARTWLMIFLANAPVMARLLL